MIRRIEVEFTVPVELTEEEERSLYDLVDHVCRRHQPPGQVHWLSGCGLKPIWSQADCRFLGKPIDPTAPESGEPTWDAETLHFESSVKDRTP